MLVFRDFYLDLLFEIGHGALFQEFKSVYGVAEKLKWFQLDKLLAYAFAQSIEIKLFSLFHAISPIEKAFRISSIQIDGSKVSYQIYDSIQVIWNNVNQK